MAVLTCVKKLKYNCLNIVNNLDYWTGNCKQIENVFWEIPMGVSS